MGMKLDAGDFSRKDIYLIDPEFIEMNDELNGRAEPHPEERIEAMVQSLLDNGQLQAALGRKIAGNKVALVAGNCRAKAIKRINEKGLTSERMKLAVRIVDCNEEEAFVRNVAENMHRAELTPVDHAHNQRRLRERYGWDDKKIADFYRISQAYVSQLKKTLQLPTDIQDEVRSGNMPMSAALDVADLPADQQKQVVEESKNGDGKVDSTKVKKKVRDNKIEQGKGKTRSIKEVREFFESLTGPAESDGVKKLSGHMIKFINGKISDGVMESRYREIVNRSA